MALRAPSPSSLLAWGRLILILFAVISFSGGSLLKADECDRAAVANILNRVQTLWPQCKRAFDEGVDVSSCRECSPYYSMYCGLCATSSSSSEDYFTWLSFNAPNSPLTGCEDYIYSTIDCQAPLQEMRTNWSSVLGCSDTFPCSSKADLSTSDDQKHFIQVTNMDPVDYGVEDVSVANSMSFAKERVVLPDAIAESVMYARSPVSELHLLEKRLKNVTYPNTTLPQGDRLFLFVFTTYFRCTHKFV